MRHPLRRLAAILALLTVGAPAGVDPHAATSEIDAFMAQVIARRDENWRKLRQYVLDERERAELLGPGGARMYGLARDYTWYIREGVFVRSPVRFDGVSVSDADRDRYEREWLARDARRAKDGSSGNASRDAEPGTPEAKAPAGSASGSQGGELDPDALARIAREPQFVSMAYFLRFRFEPGHYAFAGREEYAGHQAYKIEYYPSRLFTDAEPKPGDAAATPAKDDEDARLERQMNKVALVTLWIEPEHHQILRYTFQNMAMDFMPARWLVRVSDLQASMRMVQAFPGVWLPGGIEGEGSITLASGSYTFRYRTDYSGFREATTKARIR
jgi:hypothetical protein